MSYFSQVFAIMTHQFLSGAAGLAVLVAVARALKRAHSQEHWQLLGGYDPRLIYFVIPLSVVWAIPLAWQGVPQTWKPYWTANLMGSYTGAKDRLTKAIT